VSGYKDLGVYQKSYKAAGGIQDVKRVSERGNLYVDKPNTQSSGIDTPEYSGRLCEAQQSAGIQKISGDGTGLVGERRRKTNISKRGYMKKSAA
jgi:hypothetical protein